MTAANGQRPAPDLFTALQMEGGLRGPAEHREAAASSAEAGAVPIDVDFEEDVTAPRDVSELADEAGAGGLADLLEPGPKPTPAATVDDEQTTQPVKVIKSPIVEEPSAPIVDLGVDVDEPAARKRIPWGFVAMTVMMAGALLYVLYSQTDLLSGDVIAQRDAKVKAEAEAELAAMRAEQERNKKEYGTIQLNTKPDGARVWLVKRGPEAAFENLPRANEYHVFVDAPGHVPQVLAVAGGELGKPLEVQLEPIPPPPEPAEGDAAGGGTGEGTNPHPTSDGPQRLPLPDLEPPPKVDPQGDPEDVGTLTVRCKTPDASVGLHVGYTPGATLADLDTAETYDLRVTKTGFEDHAILVKGRHWEESPAGELVYMESIQLVERASPPPTVGGDDVVVLDDEPPPEVKPKKKKRRKKRRRKRRRRKRG